ncbi:DUF4097 family beta strand repeat-containing protein [Paenibacillus radicis (ex Xue et al. 2023)]|uniref:DUF4097 family beta strand repeat-containing protein n=1 Tax=Paenibacillus radicis (ex Xue et al. 2023) TaxID=2972489 RepID=A0ABT1YA99_9BACL|nr:DUF4097 family beta strand repeat-containing protein [Paenibacillus radicis (ex Xue et al. 2023)]MCR8630108.1 DUF4097 family beta strand repeat-containing protein [Paenibacillus radicis (ex Xue et al. 2023)]
MTKNKKASITLPLIVIAFVCLGYVIIKSLTSPSSSKSYTATDIQSIQVDVKNVKVHINTTEGRENKTEVEVVAKGKYDSSHIHIETKNNALVIEQTGSHKLLNVNFNNSLDVFVKVETNGTKNRLDRTAVSSQNGKIAIENLNSRAIVVQSENGEINMKEVSSDELSAHSTSGAIRLDGVNTLKLDTKTENGSNHIVFSDKLEKLIANSTSSSGNINYIFQNDIKLNLKWKGKWDSKLKSDEASTNKIVMESDSGHMSASRK